MTDDYRAPRVILAEELKVVLDERAKVVNKIDHHQALIDILAYEVRHIDKIIAHYQTAINKI